MTFDVTARDIMTADVFTVDKDIDVLQAADRMIARGVSNAPVVEHDFTRNIVVGFISEKDLMQCYASGRFYAGPELRVRDVMRPHPVCVRPEADLFTLAAIFMQHGFRHLPVVTAQVLEGMVSRRDVLAALLKHYRSWAVQPPSERRVPDLAGIFTSRYLLG
jgi:CBS domain-containing protein